MKIFKKFLSYLMVFSMILSAMPAVFSVETEDIYSLFVDGSECPLSVMPYETNLGLMISAELGFFCDVFGAEYELGENNVISVKRLLLKDGSETENEVLNIPGSVETVEPTPDNIVEEKEEKNVITSKEDNSEEITEEKTEEKTEERTEEISEEVSDEKTEDIEEKKDEEIAEEKSEDNISLSSSDNRPSEAIAAENITVAASANSGTTFTGSVNTKYGAPKDGLDVKLILLQTNVNGAMYHRFDNYYVIGSEHFAGGETTKSFSYDISQYYSSEYPTYDIYFAVDEYEVCGYIKSDGSTYVDKNIKPQYSESIGGSEGISEEESGYYNLKELRSDAMHFKFGEISASSLNVPSRVGKITVKMPNGVVADGTYNYTIKLYDPDTNHSFADYEGSSNGVKDAEIKYALPDDYSKDKVKVSISVSPSGYDESDLICDTDMYYSANGLRETIATADEINISDLSNVAITLKKAGSISGKLIYPSDFNGSEKVNNITVTLIDDEYYNYDQYTDVSVDDSGNFKVKLNKYLSGGTYKIFITVPASNSNIISAEYYALDSHGSEKQFIMSALSEISGVEFELKTGHVVSGKIKFPENAKMVNVSKERGYFQVGAVSDDDGTEYSADIPVSTLDAGGELPFSLTVPKSDGLWKIYFENFIEYDDSGYDNLYDYQLFYVDDKTSSGEKTDAKSFKIDSDLNDLVLNFQIVDIISANISTPVMRDYTGFYFSSEDEDGDIINRKLVVISKGKTIACGMKIEEEYADKDIYLKYTPRAFSDELYRDSVYINPDGTYSATREGAKPHRFKNREINVDFSLAKVGDIEAIKPIQTVESTFSYTHPTKAEKLIVALKSAKDFVIEIDGKSEKCRADNFEHIGIICVTGNSFSVTNNYAGNSVYIYEIIPVGEALPEGYFRLTYKDDNGSVLYQTAVKEGEYPDYKGSVPKKEISGETGYLFDGWDGDCYSAVTKDTVLTAKYTECDVIHVTCEEELVNAFEYDRAIISIENDIELKNDWITPGIFNGYLAGNGHTISNINVAGSKSKAGYGFIGEIYEYSVAENLRLVYNQKNPAESVYSFSGFAGSVDRSELTNIGIEGKLKADNFGQVYGFAMLMTNSMANRCYAEEKITVYNDGATIVGFAGNLPNTSVLNSYSAETISGSIGFIAGFSDSIVDDTVLKNCISNIKNDELEVLSSDYVYKFGCYAAEVLPEGIENCYYGERFNLKSTAGKNSVGKFLWDYELTKKGYLSGFDYKNIWRADESINNGYIYLYGVKFMGCAEHEFGETTVEREETVLNGRVTVKSCKNCSYVERTTGNPKNPAGNSNYHQVMLRVLDDEYTDRDVVVPGAQIYITTSNEGERTFTTDSTGEIVTYLPIGHLTIGVYAEGYQLRNVELDITKALNYSEQNGVIEFPVRISKRPTVEAKMTSKVMTLEEIEEAGIDTDAIENKQVVKYDLTLKFGTETHDITTYFTDDHIHVGKHYETVVLSSGTKVRLYPVSEKFYLMVYGEIQWLKEMFDVEMLVVNNMTSEIFSEGTAELSLPDGLSLATMKDGEQSALKELSDIGGGESQSVHWFVRGDKEGEYYISAKLKGNLAPKDKSYVTKINEEYTVEEPVKVYAGSALKMTVTVPDMTFYGDNYPVRISITNVSDRTLYNVSHSIKGFKEAKITRFSDKLAVEEVYMDEEELASLSSKEFKVGDELVIEVNADIEFRSRILRASLGELKDEVEGIDALSKAFEAFLAGAAEEKDGGYLFYTNVSESLEKSIAETDLSNAEKNIRAEELKKAVNNFAELLKSVNGKKSVELVRTAKSNGIYKILLKINADKDLFDCIGENEAKKTAKRINAIIDSANLSDEDYKVTEEELYDVVKQAIESIPIKFYLEKAIVTTLPGSTTKIPCEIITLSLSERFCSVGAVDGLLDSLIKNVVGELKAPSYIGVRKGLLPEKKVPGKRTIVKGKSARFAVTDTSGCAQIKVWTEGGKFDLSCTEEYAEKDENGALCFSGGAYVDITAKTLEGGKLFISIDGKETFEYIISVVDSHVCRPSDEWVSFVDSSDEYYGYTVKICAVCGEIVEFKQGEKACANHIFGDYKVEKEATGDVLGIKYRVCDCCGYVQRIIIDLSEDVTELVLTGESYFEKDLIKHFLNNVPTKMNTDQLKSHFENQNIEIRNNDGNIITASVKVGTGFKVAVKNEEDGTTTSELTVVIKGDTDGNGEHSVNDIVNIFNHIMGKNELAGAKLEAANVNGDKRVSVSDWVELFNIILNQ